MAHGVGTDNMSAILIKLTDFYEVGQKTKEDQANEEYDAKNPQSIIDEPVEQRKDEKSTLQMPKIADQDKKL